MQPFSFYRTEELEEIGASVGESLRSLGESAGRGLRTAREGVGWGVRGVRSGARSVFGIQDAPTTPMEDMSANLPWWERRRLGNRGLIDELFRRFGVYGYRYDVGTFMPETLMGLPGSGYLRTDLADGLLSGNCLAYARAFALLLQNFGFEAEGRYVRLLSQGSFVTKVVRNFIDPQVTGNIRYKNGGIIPGRYLFSTHAATWVPSLRLFYDPMIRESYADFNPYIDRGWALTSMDGSDDRYWLANPQYGGNAVVRTEIGAPGFTSTWQIVKRKGRYRGR